MQKSHAGWKLEVFRDDGREKVTNIRKEIYFSLFHAMNIQSNILFYSTVSDGFCSAVLAFSHRDNKLLVQFPAKTSKSTFCFTRLFHFRPLCAGSPKGLSIFLTLIFNRRRIFYDISEDAKNRSVSLGLVLIRL